MKIQFNTDKNIQGTEQLETLVSEKINSKLKRFADKITRIEVHLSDQNGQRASTDDKQCKIEARVEGLQPIIVTGKSSTKTKAINDAIEKMKAVLNTVTGKIKDK
ncbi:MAG TPA: HPF/RaiA family ribosome-associated protein [Lutibacter sp.]|nr:HPF/RaiA family ribosome-associated protein [Lutibacter sp.]